MPCSNSKIVSLPRGEERQAGGASLRVAQAGGSGVRALRAPSRGRGGSPRPQGSEHHEADGCHGVRIERGVTDE